MKLDKNSPEAESISKDLTFEVDSFMSVSKALLYVVIFSSNVELFFISLFIFKTVSKDIELTFLPQHFLYSLTPDFFSLTFSFISNNCLLSKV